MLRMLVAIVMAAASIRTVMSGNEIVKWEASTMPGARRKFGIVHIPDAETKGAVMIAGGKDGTGFLDSVYMYDLEKGKWGSPTTAMPDRRSSFGMVYVPTAGGTKGAVMVAGGYRSGGLDSVYFLDVDTGLWGRPAAKIPGKVYSVGIVFVRNTGGAKGTVMVASQGLMYFYDIQSDTWNTRAATMPDARHEFGMVLIPNTNNTSGTVMLAGGYLHGAGEYQDSVFFYDIDTGKFGGYAAKMPVPRTGFGMVHIPSTGTGGAVMVAGGESKSQVLLDSVYFYDVDAQEWTEPDTPMPNAINNFGIVHVPDNRVGSKGTVMVTGGNDAKGISDSVYISLLAKPTTTTISSTTTTTSTVSSITTITITTTTTTMTSSTATTTVSSTTVSSTTQTITTTITSTTTTTTITMTTATTSTTSATSATDMSTTSTLNAAQLLNSGKTIEALVQEGMDVKELVDRGFTNLELVQAPGANITIAELESAGVSRDDIVLLRSTLADLENSSGGSPGIIIGAVVVVLIIVGVVVFCTCRSDEKADSGAASESDESPQNVQRRPKKAGSSPQTQGRPISSTGARQRSSSDSRSASWMQDASRTVAEAMLKGCRSGTFLVRPRNDDESFAFSVVIRNRVIHKLLIKESLEGDFTVDGESGDWGTSLESVVAVVSLQLSTKYECAMYPLSAAAQKPEQKLQKKTKHGKQSERAKLKPKAPPRRINGRPTAIVEDEAIYAEADETVVEMHTTYANTGAITSDVAGLYETAFSTNPAYGSVATGAVASVKSQDSYASLLSVATAYDTRSGTIDADMSSDSDIDI